MENTVDPDLIALSADLDLQCSQIVVNQGSAGQGLIIQSLASIAYIGTQKNCLSERVLLCTQNKC